MGDNKPNKEQLNEILKNRLSGKLEEKAMPLKKPPISLTQQVQSTQQSNSNNEAPKNDSQGKN